NTALPVKQRVTAVRALRGGQFAAVEPILKKTLELQEQPELQTAAIDTIAAFDEPAVANLLLASWQRFTPEVRQNALTALLSERERMKAVMKALEDGQIERTLLDPAMRAKLLDHPDKTIADRARDFFKQEADERTAAVAAYKDALKLTGDVNRGRDI